MTQGSNTGGGAGGGSGSTDRFETTDFGSSMSSPVGTGSSTVSSGTGSMTGMGGSTSGGGSMTDFGSGSQGSASGAVQQAVDTAQNKAGQFVDQAQDKAGQVIDQARETVTTQASSQKDRAAESLTTLAQAIRQTGDQLRGQEQGTVAGYTDQAAQYIERVSGFLRERDINDMLYEIERYARRNPTAFIGGAFAVGLLAGRFLKSSSRPDYQGSSTRYAMAPRTSEYVSRSYTYRGGPDYGSSQTMGGGSYGASSGVTSYGSGSGYSSGTSGSLGAGTGTTGTSGAIGGTTGGTLGGQTRLTDADTGLGSSDQFSARREEL